MMKPMQSSDIRELLSSMFQAAIDSAAPGKCLPAFLPPYPSGRTIVIGAGKAAASMAQALEGHWTKPLTGLVVTRYGYAVPTKSIKVVEASHPVPDAAGLNASQRMLEMVRGLSPDDLVICLISGGGSSLLPLPAKGLSITEKQAINKELLRCGATISEMNCVRRHLSGIKGGRLAAACYPAKVVTLLISDVPGDNPIDIASGPTVPDPTTCEDALEVVSRYRIELPEIALEILRSGAGETVKPDDPRLSRNETHLIATPELALDAARKVAERAGIATHILGDNLEGEARSVGTVMAGIARRVATRHQPFKPPCVLLSGGETTVTVRGHGRGGRNVEFLLSMAIALDGSPHIYALAGDTDGVDGIEEIAGAIVTPDSLTRAWKKGISAAELLANNDGHSFFEAIGDSVKTGPTLTNVNDFRAIYIAE